MAKPKRILVCDDDPAVLRLIEVNLEIEGYDVMAAHHGEEAVELARTEKPDLIILDVMMPKLDGYGTAKKLKSLKETKNIPVVFLSAKTQQVDIEKGKSFGVDDYLTKPFDPVDLIEVVERLTA